MSNVSDKIAETAIDVVAHALPSIIDWAAGLLAGGASPDTVKAELKARLAVIDASVDAYENKVFGDG